VTIGGDPIYFPDAVSSVIAYFRTIPALTGTAIHQVEPNPLPTTPFILVRRFGGHLRNVVTDDAYVTVECWATNAATAHDTARIARAALYAGAGHYMGGAWCSRVGEIGGLSWSPDLDTAHPRYLWTSSVSLRGGPAL